MRKVIPFVGLALVFATGLLYSCGSDGNAVTSTPDASMPQPTGSATTSTPPSQDATVDTNQPDTTPPAYAPTDLGARLVLWLDADKGYSVVDGGVVWKDQSSAANNARQDDPSRQPGHVDGGAEAGIGSRGAVHFAGSQFLSITDATSLQWSASDFAFFVVLRYVNTPASYAIVFGKWTDVAPFPGFFLWADYPYNQARDGNTWSGYVSRFDFSPAREVFSAADGMDNGTARLVGVRRVGDKLQMRVNGAMATEIADAGGFDTAGFDAVGVDAVIGGRPALIQALQGDISELVAVKGSLSDAEQTKLEAYLKTKYGL